MPEKSTDSESPCAREISKISKKTYFSGSGKSTSSPIPCILSSSSDEEDTSVESPRGVRIFEKKDAGKNLLSSTDQVKPLSHQPEPLELGEDFQDEEHLELSVPGEVSMISLAEEAVLNNHLEAAHHGNFAEKEVFPDWNRDERTPGFQIATPDVEMPSDQQPSGIIGTMDFTGAAQNTDPIRPNGLEEDSDKDPLQNKSDQSGLRSQFTELHRPNLLDVPNLAAIGIEERGPSLPASEEHDFWWCPVGHGALLMNRKGTCMASTVLQFP